MSPSPQPMSNSTSLGVSSSSCSMRDTFGVLYSVRIGASIDIDTLGPAAIPKGFARPVLLPLLLLLLEVASGAAAAVVDELALDFSTRFGRRQKRLRTNAPNNATSAR